MEEKFIESIKKVLGDDLNISLEDKFSHHQLDDLDIMAVVIKLEQDFDIAVDDSEVERLKDFRQLHLLVKNKMSANCISNTWPV